MKGRIFRSGDELSAVPFAACCATISFVNFSTRAMSQSFPRTCARKSPSAASVRRQANSFAVSLPKSAERAAGVPFFNTYPAKRSSELKRTAHLSRFTGLANAASDMGSGTEDKSGSPSSITVRIGYSEASVTTPSPAMPDDALPATRQMPIPRASTSGTVTGPVVIPPQSQAMPVIARMFGLRRPRKKNRV